MKIFSVSHINVAFPGRLTRVSLDEQISLYSVKHEMRCCIVACDTVTQSHNNIFLLGRIVMKLRGKKVKQLNALEK